MQPIYLDFNSTTPLLPAVWEAMLPYFTDRFGNASSSHSFGRHARRGLDDARQAIARLLDCEPDEIVFTSGATEANNLALFGLAAGTPTPILTSDLEHPCVTEPLARLRERGYALLSMPVDSYGCVTPDALPPGADAARLAVLMLANHETGAVQPVRRLHARLDPGARVHCDAAAAAGKMAFSFRDLGVSTLALTAHKFYGPKGIGALLVRRGVRLQPLLLGGPQQHGTRPGTEPVALIVGMARALELALAGLQAKQEAVRALRDRFLTILRAEAAPIHVNGCVETGLAHTLNVSFPGCKADALLIKLDLAGIACSTGSACSSGSLLPSPVIRAMGAGPDVLSSAMRFGFSAGQSMAEIEEAASRIVFCVRQLRACAPIGGEDA